MAGAGADVAITYVNSRQAAENVAAEMRALGVRARPVRADQADPAAAAAVVRQVAEEFGRLDILVNNAAVAVLGPIDGPVPDGAALDRQIRVNYTSIVAAIRAAARAPRGGPHHQYRLGDRDAYRRLGGRRPRGHEGGARRVHPGRGA